MSNTIPSLDASFWSQRYNDQQTGWDLGAVSPPLQAYIDQLEDKNLEILIPGAGNAWEAEYLWQQGFKKVTVIDLAAEALTNIKARIPAFPDDQLVEGNFFDHEMEYDLILEQTFFCALNPSLRPRYVKHMSECLKPGGKLVGLLFDDPLFADHPPFGGNENIYRPLFSKHLEIELMERCTNSIGPRQGRELFFKVIKS